ncbi:MAG: AI-2E family transporter [Arcanobacterium sp.]|nr:AI-2E family transporter [Arcanobacterium sp.]
MSETSNESPERSAELEVEQHLIEAELNGENLPPRDITIGLDRHVPVGLVILAVISLMTIAFTGLHFVQGVFAPFFLGLTLVLAFRPIGRGMVKRGLPIWFAITTTFSVLIVVFVGIVSLVVWSFTPVPVTLMNYSGRFRETVAALSHFLKENNLQSLDVSKLLSNIDYNTIITFAFNFVDQFSRIGGLLAIVVVALFFITLDTATMKARAEVSRRWHSNLAIALEGFEKRVRAYWIISTVFGLIVAVVDVIALQMLAIPLAWTWGIWAFVTNYIPNIGFIIGVLPPMLMALLDQGWQAMLWVMVLYSVINVVIQTFVQPKFTGDVVGLSPTVTFISLVVWTSIVGILGSILAVPLTLFFKALLVDADPRTRWLDVFLISEKDLRQRQIEGRYDVDIYQKLEEPRLTGTFETINSHLPNIGNSNRNLRKISARIRKFGKSDIRSTVTKIRGNRTEPKE